MSQETNQIPAALLEELWPLSHVKVGPILQQREDRLAGALLADEGRLIYKIVNQARSEDMEFERGRARAFFGTYFEKRSLPELDKSLIFDAGLLSLLGTCRYGDSPRTWRHILYALKNRALVISVLNEQKPDPRFEEDFVELVAPEGAP